MEGDLGEVVFPSTAQMAIITKEKFCCYFCGRGFDFFPAGGCSRSFSGGSLDEKSAGDGVS